MGIFTTIFANPPRFSGFARGNGIKSLEEIGGKRPGGSRRCP